MDIGALFEEFLRKATDKNDPIELTNEAGLQFDFAWFIKCKKGDHRFQFEVNAKKKLNNESESVLCKKEIDLLIDNKIAIEFKFPTNGAYPKRISQSIQDLAFLYQLKQCKFIEQGYAVFITEDHTFFNRDLETDGIYSFFRGSNKFKIEKIMDLRLTQYLKEKVINTFNFEAEFTMDIKSIHNKYFYYVIKI